MRELLKKDQIVTIVPHDFKDTNKGKITEVSMEGFKMKLKYVPKGLIQKHICDFYSFDNTIVRSADSFHLVECLVGFPLLSSNVLPIFIRKLHFSYDFKDLFHTTSYPIPISPSRSGVDELDSHLRFVSILSLTRVLSICPLFSISSDQSIKLFQILWF